MQVRAEVAIRNKCRIPEQGPSPLSIASDPIPVTEELSGAGVAEFGENIGVLRVWFVEFRPGHLHPVGGSQPGLEPVPNLEETSLVTF